MTCLVWIGGKHQDDDGYYNSGSPLLLCCHVLKISGRFPNEKKMSYRQPVWKGGEGEGGEGEGGESTRWLAP